MPALKPASDRSFGMAIGLPVAIGRNLIMIEACFRA
jgi:hypothetical protein